MESIVGVMKKVAEQEARKIYTTELGVVTAIFPHAADSDKDNYQCSIRLKNKKLPDGGDFELRKVPVATQHMGLVNIPNVGDLVLVTFIGGDLNAPVIIGRLHNDADQPPLNKEKEYLLKHNLTEGGSFKIDAEGVITLTSKNEKYIATVKDEHISLVSDKASATIEGGTVTVKNEQCTISEEGGTVTIKNDQCTITEEGGNITIKNNMCKILVEAAGITIDNGVCKITIESAGITLDAGGTPVTVKSLSNIKIGDATTGMVQVGGRMPGFPIVNGDTLILASHQHVGNLGAPCPIMVPTEVVNCPQALARNTQVG